jgi:serine/threonine protein kinase/Tfp pilus assembly protein PilF
MNNHLRSEITSWPQSLALQVEDICSRFETAWKAGRKPQIETYLGQTPEPRQSVLLRELLALELEFRRQRGDEFLPEDYLLRFAERADVVREVFHQEAPSLPPAAGPTPLCQGQIVPGASCADQIPSEATGPYLSPRTNGDAAWNGNSPPERPGRRFPAVPGYEILGVLGQGGMGVVYRARQLALKRLVALKMIRSGANARAQELARFRVEAEAVAQLQHPNIVHVYEVGEYDGLPYLSLEYVDGGSLKRLLAGTPLPARQAAQLVETLARAIQTAHQRGIIHRDLKPANVLLQIADCRLHIGQQSAVSNLQSAIPKIVDFGLAKQLDEDVGRTNSGAILGTPSYMAPEQADGKGKAVGPATDVYALGAILYETLTGRPPFRAATILETLEQVRTQEPVSPRRLQPKLPRDLETICLKCLHKEPRKRYPNALSLADDLHRFLAGEAIRARPTPLWERGFKWAKRRRSVAALAALSAVALLGLVAGTLLYQEQRARVAEHQLAQRRRTDEARAKVQDLVFRAQRAVSGGDWQEAKPHLAGAIAVIASEPSLADLQARAERLRAETDRALAHQEARRQALDKRRQFFTHRDRALFHGTLFTGVDLATNVKISMQAARQGLALLRVSPEGGGAPAWEPSFSDCEQRELTASCYELLLVLAEATARQDSSPAVEQALRILDRAAQLGLRTRAYHLRRARYLKRLGDDPAAERESRRAASMPAASPVDFFLIGDENFREGQLTAAVTAFEKVLRYQRAHFWAHYLLAVCHLSLPGPGGPQAAKAYLTACIDQQPRFYWLYVLRGFAHGQLNEFKAAEDDFQTALRLPRDDGDNYALFVNRGVLRMRQNKYAEAAADLQRAIRLQPNQYQGYANLAEVYQQQNQLGKALGQLDKAMATAHRSFRANQLEPSALVFLHCRRGSLLLRQEKYREALAAYREALTIDPKAADAHAGCAIALGRLNRYAEAATAIDQYLRHGGKPTPQFFLVRGRVRAGRGDYPGAIDDYTHALLLQQTPAALVARGWVYLVNDAFSLAQHDFDAALRLNAKNGEAYIGRAYVRVRLGRYHEAVADAEKALARGPRNRRMFWNAARVYAQVVGRMDADPAERNGRALETCRRYQDRAFQLIRQAVQHIAMEERASFWDRCVEKDAAFNSVRRSPEYVQLARECSLATR